MRQADDTLLRKILQRTEEFFERATTMEQSIQETSEVLERISSAIEKTARNQIDRSPVEADTTAALSEVLPRLQCVEEKMPDVKAVTAPVRQDLARLADRIGDFSRKLDSRLPEEDGQDGDVTKEIQTLGMLANRQIDDIEKGIIGIWHDIDAIDPVSLMRKRGWQVEAWRPPDPVNSLPVFAGKIPEGFDPEDFRATVGVVHELHDQLGIALTLLDMTLPEGGRERAVAKRAEEELGRDRLGPWSDFEWGMINGKLSALRWVLGDD